MSMFNVLNNMKFVRKVVVAFAGVLVAIAVMGSIVANDVTITGGSSFHYDESLANVDNDAPFRIGYWSEMLSATDRAAYAADFEF